MRIFDSEDETLLLHPLLHTTPLRAVHIKKIRNLKNRSSKAGVICSQPETGIADREPEAGSRNPGPDPVASLVQVSCNIDSWSADLLVMATFEKLDPLQLY